MGRPRSSRRPGCGRSAAGTCGPGCSTSRPREPGRSRPTTVAAAAPGAGRVRCAGQGQHAGAATGVRLQPDRGRRADLAVHPVPQVGDVPDDPYEHAGRDPAAAGPRWRRPRAGPGRRTGRGRPPAQQRRRSSAVTAPAPEVVKYYTRARKFPQLIGRTPDGAKIWGGPYTFTQAISAGVVLFVGVNTMGLWAHH